MEGMQKRKASPEPALEPAPEPAPPAPQQRRVFFLGSATPPPGVDEQGRRIVVPRCDVVFRTEDDNVLRLWVKDTDSLAAVYSKVQEHMGGDVEMYQDFKKKHCKLDPKKTADDGMHFGYPVQVKRVVQGEAAQTAKKAKTTETAKQAKSAKDAKDAKDAKAAGPAADKGGSSHAAGHHIKQDPPPAGVPRGVPGGWMLAQAPRKPDADGNVPEIEYTKVFVHQGM